MQAAHGGVQSDYPESPFKIKGALYYSHPTTGLLSTAAIIHNLSAVSESYGSCQPISKENRKKGSSTFSVSDRRRLNGSVAVGLVSHNRRALFSETRATGSHR